MDGTSVWLDLPLAEIIPRIPLDGRRPLAADRAQLEQLYASRVEAYRHAHLRVSGSRAPSSIVAERVVEALQHLPPILQRSVI
jgi:shikimate kinase